MPNPVPPLVPGAYNGDGEIMRADDRVSTPPLIDTLMAMIHSQGTQIHELRTQVAELQRDRWERGRDDAVKGGDTCSERVTEHVTLNDSVLTLKAYTDALLSEYDPDPQAVTVTTTHIDARSALATVQRLYRGRRIMEAMEERTARVEFSSVHSGDYDHWSEYSLTARYCIQVYQPETREWVPINPEVTDYTGNSDNTQIVLHSLPNPVVAKQLRVVAQKWNAHISMRFEVYAWDN
ncbi:hypothetical protein KIPB_007412 [Kipferlia bialata]|uniref:F5/8 type C domain-containing protein n=1 Tax=Kipferlia bialata TaxID=797122 RepID=A0A9K3D083_9EUKA|nr:hypothetical protein KIPB_007412 [Kipferlia bialata]|eukprot:g7412.t1